MAEDPECDWVLVHDAARPCLRRTDLERLVESLADDPAGGLLAIPVAETVDAPVPAELPTETTSLIEDPAPAEIDPEPLITPAEEGGEAANEAASVERDPDPAPEPETSEVPARVEREPPVETTPSEPATDTIAAAPEAMCTFFCAALGNSEVTYPMTEVIELGEDEPLESLEARLEDIHARICTDSGGQLVVESLPNCTAQ